MYKNIRRTRLEWIALVIAVVVLAVGLAYALRAWPVSWGEIQWPWLAGVLLLGVPLIALANAYRFDLSFRLAGQQRRFGTLLRAAVLSSAANMLPLPGGLLVRIAYLQNAETGLRRATWITFTVSAVWIALACLMTALALAALGSYMLSAVMFGSGLLLTGWSLWSLSNLPGGWRVLLRLVPLETVVFAVQATRFLWCFFAIGYEGAWIQGLALSVANVSGAVVSIVPAGLGINELTAVLIAPFAGLEPGATFIAVLLDRVATILGLLMLACGLLVHRGRGKEVEVNRP
jgi:uncharacterized membrane protein YbhN (UPF0104 family)